MSCGEGLWMFWPDSKKKPYLSEAENHEAEFLSIYSVWRVIFRCGAWNIFV